LGFFFFMTSKHYILFGAIFLAGAFIGYSMAPKQ